MQTRIVDVDGPLHIAETGGSGPTMVLVHGLGGSHVNWMSVAPMLAERARVIALDLPGFGRTPPAGRSAGIRANARIVARFIEEEIAEPSILVGNSMGGLVSIVAAAERPDLVARLALVDPAVPPAPGTPPERQVVLAFTAYFVPGVGEAFVRRRLARLGPERLVRESLALTCYDSSRIPEDVMRAHVEMATFRSTLPWADVTMLRAARSMLAIILRRGSFRSLIRRVRPPTLLVHGEQDRLIRHATARMLSKVRPDWTYDVIPEAGHTPMLERPRETADAIRRWLDSLDRPALDGLSSRPLVEGSEPR